MSAQYENNPLVKRHMELDVSPAFDAYTGVEIVVDENTSYFAGSTGGRVITINNPWGTQAMADNIIADLRGFTYQPYTASGALLNPAAEIGDAVTLDVRTYSGIFKLSKSFGSLMAADIEAPQDEEIDHEYPFEPKQNREITRKFSAIDSEFRIQSNEIAAKVSQTGGSASSVSWSLTAKDWTVKANGNEVFKVDKSGATVTGKITATSGKIGGFDIGTNAISYNGLTWNGTKNGIYLGSSGIQLGSKNGAFFQASNSGVVKAHNMTLTGRLNIGGTDIEAAALRGGAQSAYTNGGTWSGTSTTVDNTFNKNSKVEYLNAKNLHGDILGANQLTIPYGSQVFSFAGQWVTWQSKTINGVTINYLGR